MKKAGLLTAAALGTVLIIAPVAAQGVLETGAAAVNATSELQLTKQQGKPRNGGGTIALGEQVEGFLSEDTATYVMEGRAGQRIRISLTSARFDTVLRVTGPDGFETENDDAPGSDTLDSRIDAVLPADGTYRLTVSAYANEGGGSFRLATMDPANPTSGNARAIALGETASGILTQSDERAFDGAFVDYFTYSGRAGQRVTFDLGSSEIDTTLAIFLPDGREEKNDDFRATDGTDSRLSITLPQDGIYHIAASSFAPGETGRYSISLSEAEAGVRTVRPASGSARVFALTVGVADYARISPLNRTDEDAERVTAALQDAGVLAPESVTLINRDATRANFSSALGNITGVMGDDDLLLVFFSGHGEKVENMTTERDGSAETIELYDAPLFDYELAQMFEGIDARTLLVIDACFAAGFDNVVRQRNNRMGIFSSDEDTLSLVAVGEKSGGYISHVFRQAIEGGADLNGDRAVEAGELSEYMRREFYRMVLEEPLVTDAEDFRDMQSPGWQHIVVDRGGDGMPHQQVLMNFGSADGNAMARR
ncbi:pre-peptidase C-terminal domain-containing protein [Erythrobacter alti]|uniref:pre-peptidase C-terminal domain-containing protein n=1 Tax=Erythrobacter alti TaxID=1896145 RepID=UPI0030F3A67A